MDRLASVTDERGNTTTYTHNALGRVIGVTNKDGTETASEYDANGALVKAVDDKDYEIAFTYDADNRRFTAVDPILDSSGYDLWAYVMEPMVLGQYLYVRNNAVNWIVPFGLSVHPNNYIRWDEARSIVHEGKTYYSAYDILYNQLGATFTKNDNDTAEKHSFFYFGAEVVLKFL